MSNVIRYDALLVRQLAAELTARYGGQVVRGVEMQADATKLTIDVGEDRLVWNLHAAAGHLGRTPAILPLERPAVLPRKAVWKRAHALFDERVLIIELAGQKRQNATFHIVVELLTNQWNVLTLDADERVIRQLRSKRSGVRDLRRGQSYRPPPGEPRSTASRAEWLQAMTRGDDPQRTLLERFAYTSPLNAAALLAAQDLNAAFDRYQELLRSGDAFLLPVADGQQPYPHHLWRGNATPLGSLLEGSERLGDFGVAEDTVAELARRLYASERKIDRLREELGSAQTAAAATRKAADLLMTYASTISRGVSRVTLPDFEGNSIELELDPSLTPIANAQERYAEARKQQRACERIPQLIGAAEQTRAQLMALHERAQSGHLTAEDVRALTRQVKRAKQRSSPGEKLPYRRYRTSGGLEVRVGRNSRANDQLTLHHSSPRDIWLHARDAAGAHVVLRWQDVDGNPPMRDVMEAAILAALHSRSRTSRIVPVDWTRRKYVHKKRKSPPGQVIVERSQTVMVETDEELEVKLRWDDD